MTVLNESSAVASGTTLQIPPASWRWIGLIGILGLLVICLNTALFILVQKHEHAIAAREDDVRRRLVEATAREAQLGAIRVDIASLEDARTAAARRREDAEKGAADAERLQVERNRLFADKSSIATDLSRVTAEVEGQKRQLESLRTENASATKTAATKSEEIKLLETRRDSLIGEVKKLEERKGTADREAESARKDASDAVKLKTDRDATHREWQERLSEVARLKSEVEGLRATKNSLSVNEAAARKADELRSLAEQSLAKVQDESQAAQQRLIQVKAEWSRSQQLLSTQTVNETAVQQAVAARAEAETTLAKIRDELTTAEKRLATTRTELAATEQRRLQMAIDEMGAKSAQDARTEAEKGLLLLQGQTVDLKSRRENAASQLDELRRQLNDENLRLQALCATSNESASPGARNPPSGPSTGPRSGSGPLRPTPRQPPSPAPRPLSQP